MESKRKNVIHRRKWLTLEEKLKIIQANEDGKTKTKIAREQGMNESSVRSILRKKDSYKSLGASISLYRLKSFARHRSLLLEKVEKQLIAWIKDKNRKRILLTEMGIQKKALALFNELNKGGESKEKFLASQGWFYRFKNRIRMQNCIISGEKPSPDKKAAEKFRFDFLKIVQDGGYDLHQVFNVEETSFCWKKIPSQGLETEKDQQERKPLQDSLTILLGNNAAGDFKLKPMIVYRTDRPSGFKDCKKNSLPVIWRSNKKAWLTKELFDDWFKNYFCPTVKTYCCDHGLQFKILLLLDSTPKYDVSSLNDNVKVVFLPQNTATLLQPLTLSVFPLLKVTYLRQMLHQALSSSAPDGEKLKEFWLSYNIKKGIDNICKCWCDITPEDLAVSWHQLLPDIKVKDFGSQMGYIIHDVVTMSQTLGFERKDIEEVQNCTDSLLKNLDLPEFEEIMCKTDTTVTYEDEQDDKQGLNPQELEKIIQSINAACELIAAADSNSERSLKIQKMLQDVIEPYKHLYKTIQDKSKYESQNI